MKFLREGRTKLIRSFYLSQNRRLRSLSDLQFSPTATIPLFPIYMTKNKHEIISKTRCIYQMLKANMTSVKCKYEFR